MKFIIDLIEDVREQIGNAEGYAVTAGLLKKDENDSQKLIYSGEAPLSSVFVNSETKQLEFKINSSLSAMRMGDMIPSLLILDMDAMMYALKIEVNAQYQDMEVIGFAKNEEAQKYILWIQV